LRTIFYLIDTMACDTQGTQKQLLETIRRLDRSAWSPHLVCLWESPWMRTARLPCPVHVLGHRGFLKPGFPRVLRDLGALIDSCDACLVHAYFDESVIVGWLGARLARRRPVLVSSRRDMGLGAGNQPWYHGLFPLVLQAANRDFGGIVTNSEVVRAYAAHRERTAASRYVVIRNGIDPVAARPADAIPHEGPLRVGIVASLTAVKRHDVLLAAWSRLPLAVAETAELHVLGEGPERPALEQQAAALGIAGAVRFHGAVTDVAERLDALDIGVLCSDREGLSNAILEYMAHGLPVVATDAGGNGELVDGTNGILVPTGDPDALARALADLLADGDRRRELGARSRRRIDAGFTWDAAMRDLTGFYERLLAGA
jgi:glycosyltransferase involved in cell wall biosynthesis